MKTPLWLVIAATCAATVPGFGQGTVIFRNDSDSLVLDGRTGLPAEPALARAGLYFSLNPNAVPDPSVPQDEFLLIGTAPIINGLYGGGNQVIPGAGAGQSMLLQVRGWSATFASYGEAVQSGHALVGASNVMGPLSLEPSGTIDLRLLVDGFTLTPVPEPSLAPLLLVLGLAAMRKRRAANTAHRAQRISFGHGATSTRS